MKKLWAGVPEGIRTPDPRFRKPVLYPAELRGPARLLTQAPASALAKRAPLWLSCESSVRRAIGLETAVCVA
jgi:hypothetical protein